MPADTSGQNESAISTASVPFEQSDKVQRVTSPDGKWLWDGSAWLAVTVSAGMAEQPERANIFGGVLYGANSSSEAAQQHLPLGNGAVQPLSSAHTYRLPVKIKRALIALLVVVVGGTAVAVTLGRHKASNQERVGSCGEVATNAGAPILMQTCGGATWPNASALIAHLNSAGFECEQSDSPFAGGEGATSGAFCTPADGHVLAVTTYSSQSAMQHAINFEFHYDPDANAYCGPNWMIINGNEGGATFQDTNAAQAIVGGTNCLALSPMLPSPTENGMAGKLVAFTDLSNDWPYQRLQRFLNAHRSDQLHLDIARPDYGVVKKSSTPGDVVWYLGAADGPDGIVLNVQATTASKVLDDTVQVGAVTRRTTTFHVGFNGPVAHGNEEIFTLHQQTS